MNKKNTSNYLLVAKYTDRASLCERITFGAIGQQHNNVIYGWVYLDLYYAETRDTRRIHCHGPLCSLSFMAPNTSQPTSARPSAIPPSSILYIIPIALYTCNEESSLKLINPYNNTTTYAKRKDDIHKFRKVQVSQNTARE